LRSGKKKKPWGRNENIKDTSVKTQGRRDEAQTKLVSPREKEKKIEVEAAI